jgi:hypothetical protein
MRMFVTLTGSKRVACTSDRLLTNPGAASGACMHPTRLRPNIARTGWFESKVRAEVAEILIFKEME